MFLVTSNPDNSYKLGVFQPIVFTADIITDKYTSGGLLFNQFIYVIGENEDGNCICTWASAVTYFVDDCIYLMSGIYKGKHKIYRVNGTSNFHILTKYIGGASDIGVHYIKSDISGLTLGPGQVGISKFTTSFQKLIYVTPTINESNNTVIFDASGYLKTIFQSLPIITDEQPNPSSIRQCSITFDDTSFFFDLLYAAKPHSEIFSKINTGTSFDELIIPMVSNKVILFQNYNNIIPFNTIDGIIELIISPFAGSVIDYINYFSIFFTYDSTYFEICNLCANEAFAIHFLNKYGAYQTYVPIGNYSFGKTFIDPKDITDYQGSKLIADSGMIYKTCTIEMVNLNKSHIDILEELVESPITKIWDGANVQECIIEKKDFEFYKTQNEYHNAKITVIFSEKINVQTR